MSLLAFIFSFNVLYQGSTTQNKYVREPSAEFKDIILPLLIWLYLPFTRARCFAVLPFKGIHTVCFPAWASVTLSPHKDAEWNLNVITISILPALFYSWFSYCQKETHTINRLMY